MSKTLRLKWYSALLLGIQLFFLLLQVYTFSTAIFFNKLRYKYILLKYGHNLSYIILVIIGIIGSIGIILLYFKKKEGWILTFSALIFSILLYLSFLRSDLFIIIFSFILLVLTILATRTIFSKKIMQEFEITRNNYLVSGLISIGFFLIYLFCSHLLKYLIRP